jgi:hypothetical protein
VPTRFGFSRSTVIHAAFAVLAALSISTGCSSADGQLDIRVLYEGKETPARIELVDAAGKAWIASDAITMTKECFAAPPPEWLKPLVETRSIFNHYTGTHQFYTAGHASVSLPPGSYALRVFKGNEFRTARRTIEITSGETQSETLSLTRWTNPLQSGWVGADDHIHITRDRAEQNPWLLEWMRAEGMAVANLLQMGTADQFDVTPQYAFGDAGVYGEGTGEGETRLFAGQEHPRTHFLGHTITLGAREAIDLRDSYIEYDGFWRESERLGGVSGFAHFGQGPAQDGLALSAPSGRIHFIEVLQTEYAAYRVWYELLDMGFRIAPSAGTDWPCIPSLPGRERVYVGIKGDLDRASFVKGMRAGRTFVSNGPILELRVEDAEIGDELLLAGPRSVHVEGRAYFDPEREDIRELDLVVGGKTVRVGEPGEEAGVLTVSADIPIRHTTWIALRTSGDKIDEIPHVAERMPEWVQAGIDRWGGGWSMEGRYEFLSGLALRPSAAHTGAVFVEVKGVPNPAAASAAKSWLAVLDDLESRIGENRIEELRVANWFPYSDGVSVDHVRGHRSALMQAITKARAHYTGLIEREVTP